MHDMSQDPTELETLLARMEADRSLEAALPFTTLAADYFRRSGGGARDVTTRLAPDRLASSFEPPSEAGRALSEVVARLGRMVEESIWLSHPRYMGHQMSSPTPAAVWSETVIAALNQSLAIQEMSPAATVIEHMLVRWLADRVGFPAGAGGTFTSGGTEANFTALLAARARALPHAWTDGVHGSAPPPVIVCGEHAHYAITRAAAQLGLGTRRAIAVPSTPAFRMDPAVLERTLDRLHGEGIPVMAVVATAGSTPTGSFDDLEAIGALCERRGAWFHVDGAHGMSAALSPARRHLVAGIERARTLAWDPHKTLLMPLSVGVVLARDERDLESAFTQDAPYIFHPGTGRRWDQGQRSFLCSRRADPVKLWVAFERYGTRAFGLLFDHLCDLTRRLHERVEAHPSFEALHAPDCNILCFRFRPGSISDPAALDELNRRLRQEYNEEGTGWITATVLGARRVLRVTVMNPRTTESDLDATLAELLERGTRLVGRI
jgi:L-2,4-diaminobutyrate decarboxylase